MLTRCYTCGSPDVPQPLALWTFPLAGIHPHCLDKLTIGRPCMRVCACVYCWMRFSAFHHVCVCIFKNEWIHTSNKSKTFKCVCVCRSAQMQECVCCCMCVCVCTFVSALCPITVFLSVGLCALRSPLLAAYHKRTVGGYWAFPIYHQNTKHSPTQFHSLPATQHWSLSCVCAFALIPFI